MPQDTVPIEWRARLCSAIDASIAFSQKAWNDKMSGQNDLFGAVQAGPAAVDLPSAEPWQQAEMSQREKAALGFYLSSHPLDEFTGILQGLKILAIADYESLSPGDTITLAGIVSSSQVRYSKKGNRFCIFRLEDQSSGVKCLVWAKHFRKRRSDQG